MVLLGSGKTMEEIRDSFEISTYEPDTRAF
jgi:hypothetical protein